MTTVEEYYVYIPWYATWTGGEYRTRSEAEKALEKMKQDPHWGPNWKGGISVELVTHIRVED